jgi:hypothetical protein
MIEQLLAARDAEIAARFERKRCLATGELWRGHRIVSDAALDATILDLHPLASQIADLLQRVPERQRVEAFSTNERRATSITVSGKRYTECALLTWINERLVPVEPVPLMNVEATRIMRFERRRKRSHKFTVHHTPMMHVIQPQKGTYSSIAKYWTRIGLNIIDGGKQ